MATSHHAHRAVMLSVAAAAGRQVRLTLCRSSEEWRDERQAEDSQQQDGNQFPQWLHSIIRVSSQQIFMRLSALSRWRAPNPMMNHLRALVGFTPGHERTLNGGTIH